MIDKESLKISDTEYYDSSIERLANEANNANEYAQKRLSARELKKEMMKPNDLIRRKFNDLVKLLDGFDERGLITKESILGLISTGIEAAPTLYDLFLAIRSDDGAFIDIICTGDGLSLREHLNKVFDEIESKMATEIKKIEEATDAANASASAANEAAKQAKAAESDAQGAASNANLSAAAANEAVDELEKKVANGDFDGKDGKSAYEIAVENGFEGSEEEWLASLAGASVWIREITIPVSGWAAAEDDADYAYVIDVALQGTTDRHCPSVTIHPQSLSVAESAELYPVVQTIDGALRFRAKRIPTADMTATAVLSSQNSESGSSAAGDSSQPATEEEVDEMLDEVFSS